MGRKKNKTNDQRIPRFTESQIDSLIQREFPTDAQEVKNRFSGLISYGLSIDRTKAAILKLAHGDLDKIQELVNNANTDPRDIILYAEYPKSNKYSWSELNELDKEEREQIRTDDWEAYLEWLHH